jgi:hypothetical protein
MLSVHSGVRQQAVGLCVVIVVVTEMRVFDFCSGVHAGDRVHLGSVATLAAVEFVTARYTVRLQTLYR